MMTDETSTSAERAFTAYRYRPVPHIELVPAPSQRPWMLATPGAFANRCMPLHVANQQGWELLSSQTIELMWNGRLGPDGLVVRYPDGDPPLDNNEPVFGNFGNGIASWRIPYIFRTPPGINLLVRGPSNRPRDGVTFLDGSIESDWLPVPVTVNWKLTRPGLVTRIEAGEPFGMIIPYQRTLASEFRPVIRDLTDDPELTAFMAEHTARRRERMEIEKAYLQTDESPRPLWDTSYVRGQMGSWPYSQVPQVKMGLKAFERFDAHREEGVAVSDPPMPAGARGVTCPFTGLSHPQGPSS